MPIIKKYRSLPLEEAVRVAHSDFLQLKDHFGSVPHIEDYNCKMYAIDFLRHAAGENPSLISPEILSDAEAHWDECNSATRLGIIDLIKTTNNSAFRPFLEKIAQTPDITSAKHTPGSDNILQGEWHRKEAREALEAMKE
jgi:hypothetical protein